MTIINELDQKDKKSTEEKIAALKQMQTSSARLAEINAKVKKRIEDENKRNNNK